MEGISKLISDIGFPIACCVGLCWFTVRYLENLFETIKEELHYNREVNRELVETNRLLANDLKEEQRNIKSELSTVGSKIDILIKQEIH